MLRVEEKEHDVFLKAAMFGERFYDGTDVSDSDAKLSDEKEDVSDVSQGKKGCLRGRRWTSLRRFRGRRNGLGG